MPRHPGAGVSVSLPVFVDRTGRRRRRIVAAGGAACAVLLASLIVLVTGLFTGAVPPVPGWPDGPRQERAGGGRPSTTTVPPSGTAPPRTVPGVPGSGPGNPAPVPTATPPGTGAPPPSSPPVDRPGRGDEHRATPHGPKSKSPGKPT